MLVNTDRVLWAVYVAEISACRWRWVASGNREVGIVGNGYAISGVEVGLIVMRLSINRKPRIDMVSSLPVDVHQNVGVLIARGGGIAL